MSINMIIDANLEETMQRPLSAFQAIFDAREKMLSQDNVREGIDQYVQFIDSQFNKSKNWPAELLQKYFEEDQETQIKIKQSYQFYINIINPNQSIQASIPYRTNLYVSLLNSTLNALQSRKKTSIQNSCSKICSYFIMIIYFMKNYPLDGYRFHHFVTHIVFIVQYFQLSLLQQLTMTVAYVFMGTYIFISVCLLIIYLCKKNYEPEIKTFNKSNQRVTSQKSREQK